MNLNRKERERRKRKKENSVELNSKSQWLKY